MALQELDTHRNLSEQDYGPWLDAATLYQDGDRYVLKTEGGYSKPYYVYWFHLAEKPARPLADLLTGELWAGDDDTSLLEESLEVSVAPIAEPR